MHEQRQLTLEHKLSSRKGRGRDHSQPLTRLQFYWQGPMLIQKVHQIALTAMVNEVLIMAMRRTYSTTRQVSRLWSLRSKTTRCSFSKDGPDVVPTCILETRRSHVVNAINTKYQSENLKWTSLKSRPWRGSTAIYRQAQSTSYQNLKTKCRKSLPQRRLRLGALILMLSFKG